MAEAAADNTSKEKPASGFLETLGDWISDNPTLVGTLLGGGLGATTGYLTPDAEDEMMSDEDRLQARLKRALIFGGIGGLGGGAIGYGMGHLANSVDKNRTSPEQVWDDMKGQGDRFGNFITHPGTWGATGGALGIAGVHKGINAVNNTSSFAWAGGNDAVKTFVDDVRKDKGLPKMNSNASISSYKREAYKLLQEGGTEVEKGLERFGEGKGAEFGKKLLSRMGVGGLKSSGVWARLGAKGLGGAALALIGALGANYFFPDKPEGSQTFE